MKKFLLALLILITFFTPSALGSNFTTDVINITATVAGCGDGIIGSGEQCDGVNLGGATCVSIGYGGGALTCKDNCTYETSACITTPVGGETGGGGGGGGTSTTKITISGRAYPLSKVVILKDGEIAVSTIAGPDSNFEVTIAKLSRGSYVFGVYGEDSSSRKSSLFTFPIYITSGSSIKVSGVFVAPTIAVDKSEVKHGDNIAIFGQSVPDSEITIQVSSEQEFFVKTDTDKGGVYLYNFDTVPLELGDHQAKSKSAFKSEVSNYSSSVDFIVGMKNVAYAARKIGKGDLNNDGRVNLIDFSIGAYWYKRAFSEAFKKIEIEKLNGDGKIDLTDFSIMAFYWTG